MVTNALVSAPGGVQNGIQGSFQGVGMPRSGESGHRGRHCDHRHGPRGNGSFPSRFGLRLHRHHHHHHMKGFHGGAEGHGHGDLSHGGRMHHGGPHHGLKGRYGSRGLHEVGGQGHGPHCRGPRHRSLSPHHLMHNGAGDGAPVSPQRGHRGHRGPGGRGPRDGGFLVFSFRGRHSPAHGREPNSASESDRSPPLPPAIEQGIEQLGQLSLRSEPGSL